MLIHVDWTSVCPACPLRLQCTTGKERRVRRWEHEHVLEAMEQRLASRPEIMNIRRSTVEHVFGTLKAWMGATHFLTKRIGNVRTEMSLQVLAYNLKRVIAIVGQKRLMEAIRVA
jgi:Transposase DDE domain